MRPNIAYDALALVGVLTGDAALVQYYPAEYDFWMRRMSPAAKQALAEIYALQKGSLYAFTSQATQALALFWPETLDDVLAVTRNTAPLRDAVAANGGDAERLIQSLPALNSVLHSLKDAGFEQYWRETLQPRMTRLSIELQPEVAKSDVLSAVEAHTQMALPGDKIIVYLAHFARPFSMRLPGTRLLASDAVVAPNALVRVAVHEMLHQPFDMADAGFWAAARKLGNDSAIADRILHHDPSIGYTNFETYFQESVVDALEQVVSERLGVAVPIDRRFEANEDDGMHLLAPALYVLMKRERFPQRGESFQAFVLRMIRETKLGPGKLATLAAQFDLMAGRSAAATRTTPAIELAPCNVGGAAAECGTITVLENRVARLGRTLDLSVALLRATGPSPAADPVFFIASGPGAQATLEHAWIVTGLQELHLTRDFVLVDQRGAGPASALTCAQPYPSLDVQFGPQGETEIATWLRRCATAAGTSLEAYDAAYAVDDYDDVRAALGYTQTNLYGGSYGAAFVQYYLMRHSNTVRTITVFSQPPVGVWLRDHWNASRQSALERLMAICAADLACHALYPDLPAEFSVVLRRLEDAPIPMTAGSAATAEPILVTRPLLRAMVDAMLAEPGGGRALPRLIHRMYAGEDLADYAGLAQRSTQRLGADRRTLAHWLYACGEPPPEPELRPGAPVPFFAAEDARDALLNIAACRELPAPWPWRSVATLGRYATTLLGLYGASPGEAERDMNAAALGYYYSVILPMPGQALDWSELDPCRLDIVTEFIARGRASGIDMSCLSTVTYPPFE